MNTTKMPLTEIDTWRWTVGSVTRGLMIGGDLPGDAEGALNGLADWIEVGVTDVLDVREEHSDEEFVDRWAEWIGYFHLGTHDNGGAQTDAWFDAGVEIARSVRSEEGAELLVHCHMGINRGPSMAFAILLDQGWDPIDALDAIRSARPIAAVAYAKDAMSWQLRSVGANAIETRRQLDRVARWHRQHDIDIARVIRRIRRVERSSAA